MAQFGIGNPLYLDSAEAENKVRRGIATDDLEADKTIDVGSPAASSPYGLRRAGQTSQAQSRYELVFDQPNTERPAVTPPAAWGGKPTGPSRYELVFDPVPEQAPAPAAPEPPKDESGDFFRGTKTALGQTPALLKGAVGFAGAAGEKTFGEGGMFSALKQYGLEGYQKDMKAIDATAKPTDDVTEAWKRAKNGDLGSLVDWAQYGLGYLTGNIVETAGTAILGSMAGAALSGPAAPVGAAGGAVAGVAGKEAVKGTAKTLIESMVAKEAAKIAERTGAKEITEQITQQATKNVAKSIGSTTALAGSSIIKETGGIYGEAEEQAKKDGRQLDAGDLARIFGSGLVAGISEAAVDKLGLDAAAGKIKIPGAGRAGRALVGGAAGVGIEGGQELFQTAVERFGASQSLTSEEAVKDYINSFALGGLGGGVVGSVSGALRSSEQPAKGSGTTSEGSAGSTQGVGSQTTQEAAAGSMDEALRDKSVQGFRRYSDDQIRETVGAANGLSFLAALHRNSSPEDQTVIRRTVERTGNLAAFDSALTDESAVEKGQALIAQHTGFTEDFLKSIRIFAATKPTLSRVKAMPIIQSTEGTQDGSQTNASNPPGQPGGSVGGTQVLGQPGGQQAQGVADQAPQSTGTVNKDNLRFSKTQATTQQSITGVVLTGSSPYLAKDQRKADKATKFIGRGSERSSTNQYAKDFGALANSGTYYNDDVVFISAEGNRSGRVAPDFLEIQAAIDAGATILTDDAANRNRPYNIGERQVTDYLAKNGYTESSPGTWTKAATKQTTPQVAQPADVRNNSAQPADAKKTGQKMVRLFRAESDPNAPKKSPAEWIQQDEDYKRMLEASGRWFTDDYNEAQWYLQNEYPGGRITFIDVPADQVEAFRVSTMEDKPGGKSVNENPKAFSRRPEKEFFVSPELSTKRAALPNIQQVQDRFEKLARDYQDDIGMAKITEMRNKLEQGRADEVEKFVDDTYASKERAPLADLRAVRKQREFLARVAERFKLPFLSATHSAQIDQMIGPLVNPDKFTDPKAAAAAESEAVNGIKDKASRTVIDKVNEVLKAEAKKQVQALVKARKANAANEVFKRSGLQAESIFSKGEEQSVEEVFNKAKQDIEQEESDVEAEKASTYVKKGYVKPTPFKFATKYITDSDFQRVIDLIVASIARGEVGGFLAPKEAFFKSEMAQQFVESLPEEKRAKIIGRDTGNGLTKGWLGNTSVADIRDVLQEQRDEGRDFGIAAKEAREKLSQEEKDVIAKKAAFQTQVSRIMNMATEAQTYRDAIARLRSEQDAIYAALNGQRNLFFKNNKGQIEIYESAVPEAQAGFIISQFEGPKNSDIDEVVKDLNGLTMSGPMQSASPERMVDMKSMYERSSEMLRKRAAQITEEIRGLQTKSTRDLAKMFRQGLLEIKTRLNNARTEAVRNGLPLSETFEIYDNALKSIRVLEDDKPTPVAVAAMETANTEPGFVPDLAAEIRANKLAQQWKAAVAEMRSGNMTLGQLVNRLETEHNVTVPQEFRSLASELSMRFTLARWLRQNNFGWLSRAQWANSLFRAAQKAKDLGFTNDLLGDLNLTDGEKFTYFSFLKDRSQLISRSAKEATTPQQAFNEFLFAKYSLDQMRDFTLIKNDKDRAIIESVFETPDAAAQAWFRDVYEAQKADAGLAKMAIAGTRIDIPGSANVATDPMIDPADAREYQTWRKQQLDAKILKARMVASSQYAKALASLDGLTDEQYGEISEQLTLASLNEKEAILRNAIALSQKMRGSPISQMDETLAEFVDQVMVDDMSYARTPAEIADAMRRASIEQVSEENVRTRKDFIGEELSGEGESGVILNDDGEFDYEADDQRLAKGKHSGVLTTAAVQSMVARITSTWKMAPNIEVYRNANMLPEPLRTQVIEKLGPDWNAKGLYNGEDGTVYLFSDFLLSEADVQFTIFHEVDGHVGLRAFLGSKLDGFLNAAYKTNQKVKALADQKMQEEGLPLLEAVEEALADLAGNGTTVSQFKALVGRLIQALRDAGLDKVADWLSGMTDAEVAYVLKSAKETARNGGQKLIQGEPGEIRLADSKTEERMPYEMFSFKDGKVRAYARYNPITLDWLVFTAEGKEDLRTNYNSMSMQDFDEVRKVMGRYGKLERRVRSGVYVDDKIASDFHKFMKENYDGWKGKLKRLWHTAILHGQNEALPVLQFVEQLRKQGRINDFNDVVKVYSLYERKTGVLLEDFEKQYVKPILDLLKKARELGATDDDINKWLIARTAEERNRQVLTVNPKNPYGSGMAPHPLRIPDADAPDGFRTIEGYLDVLAKVKNSPYSAVFEQIGKITDTMSVEKVKYEVATGLISTQDGLKRLAVYKHYVNLSGVNNELDETPNMEEIVGKKFNLKGVDKRATGRTDLAPDVLARTIQGFEIALVRGQKNKVAQTILNLMETNYDPEFVVINEQSYRRKINQDTGLVNYELDSDYIRRDDVMVAKVNGIPVTMRFKDNSAGSFAEAIHGAVYPKDSRPIMEAIGRYTQFLGQLVTTYNPAWIFVNFTRDVQTMYFNAAADKKITKQMAGQMMGKLYQSVRLAMWVAGENFPKFRSIIGQPDPELLASYYEMRKEGGLTHFINRNSLEDQVHNIEIALTGNKSPIDRIKSLLSFMEVLTLPMEMAPRLAAYHVVRKHGFSKSDAALFSGDITINFNMRGKSKELRQLFLFFNPAIQGTAKMWRLAKEDPKTFSKIAGAWVGFGFAMSFLGRALNDDDEDDINKLDKIPTYKRATSVVLKADMTGGSIPIPYGWNAFYAIGAFGMDYVLGKQTLATSGKRAAKAAIEAFSPVGGIGLDSSRADLGLLKTAMPTAALPFVEYIFNENRFGAPIYKDDKMFGAGAKTPDSYMAFDSVSPISKTLMQGLHTLTGGSRLNDRGIDINPAAMDFYINALMPGIVAESYKMASVGIKALRGEDTKPLPTPIIGRFEARVPEGYDAGAFRRAKELVDTKYKELTETRDPAIREEIRKEYPGLGGAKAILATTQQEIRRLRKMESEVENLSNASEERKIEIQNKVKAMEKKLYTRAVKATMNVGTEDNKPFREQLLDSD